MIDTLPFYRWRDWFPRPGEAIGFRKGIRMPIEFRGEPYTALTDGNMIVAARGAWPQVTEIGLPTSTIQAFADSLGKGAEVDIRALADWCGEPLAPSLMCDECFGCGGDIGDHCWKCFGFGKVQDPSFVDVYVDGVSINRRLLAVAIPKMTGVVEVAAVPAITHVYNGDTRPAAISLVGDGWLAVVMGTRREWSGPLEEFLR